MSQASALSSSPVAPRRSPAVVIAWLLAIALGAFVCVWPLSAGMSAANDDLKFIRGADYSGTLAQNLREGWDRQYNFRPLENVAALLCDEWSLEARPVMLIHFAGLAALLPAMMLLTRRLLPGSPLALPLLIIWMTLSSATTISLWQMDTCSQTWMAAAGAWIGVIVLSAFDRARPGRSIIPHLIALTAIVAIAVNIKELFYGWSAGVGGTIILVIAYLGRRERAAAIRLATLLIPIALLPALHLLARMQFGGLGRAVEVSAGAGGESQRYSVNLGMNVVTNAWVSLLGLFANGPLHLVRDVEAMLPLRLLSLVALVATFVLLTAAGALALLHGDRARATARRTLLLAALGGIASLSVTLPMGSVSELYGFGANIASGLLIVAAVLSLWNPAQADERVMCRAIVVIAAGALLIVGAYGVASRAYHFRLTWIYARQLNERVLAHQRSLSPQRPGDAPSSIYFERPCYIGPFHSQYVVPPILGIGLEQTMEWMNRNDPQRPVVFAGERILGTLRPVDLVVKCDDLPPRHHW